MSAEGETFFTVVGCMDGRVQKPVAQYGQNRFGAEFPDTITEAGLAGQLVAEEPNQALLDSLRKKIAEVSDAKHHSKGIVVDGHQECAGHPVDDDSQRRDIRAAAEIIRRIDPNLEVVPVFVVRSEEEGNIDGWKVEEL